MTRLSKVDRLFWMPLAMMPAVAVVLLTKKLVFLFCSFLASIGKHTVKPAQATKMHFTKPLVAHMLS